MRRTAVILCLLVAGWLICGQSSAQNEARSLRKISSEQLRKCYSDASVCGTTDASVISAELSRRIPDMSTDELLSCFADWHICGVKEGDPNGLPVSDEIARRGNPSFLLDRYWKEPNPAIRAGIEHVAYHFDTPQILTFMEAVFAKHLEDGEEMYFPANYLAKRRCDPEALKVLSSGSERKQGCLQFQSTVDAFGKCRYRPAIPYLVDSGLSDLCSNIVDSSAKALRTIYPQGPQTFDSPADAQKHYCGAAKKEGFTLTCSAE
jgi:hypothetical protein